jgi:putative ABC transport system ATP-binding protein
LVKTFPGQHGQVVLLDQLNLTVPQGLSASIRGPSGCGKSTLLYILSSLENADSGSVDVADKRVDRLTEQEKDDFRRLQIGLVFQQFHLIGSLNVWDNVCFTAKLANNFDKDYIHHICDELGLIKHVNKPINQLSGGEQQRVALARSLAHKPKVLFADEPTGNLDEDTSIIVSNLIYSSCKHLSTTLLLVTHSADVAEQADMLFKMQSGKLIQLDKTRATE